MNLEAQAATRGLPGPSLRVAPACGVALAFIGVSVLVGWAFDIRALKTINPDWITMKPLTAVAFVMLGVVLLVLGHRDQAEATKRAFPWLALASAAIAILGALTIFEYATGIALGIDTAIAREALLAEREPFPGRLSLQTAIAFLLLGSATLVYRRGDARRDSVVHVLAAAAGLLGLQGLLTYLFGASPNPEIAMLTPIALYTSVGVTVAAIGVIALSPGEGPLAVVTADTSAAGIVRRLLAGTTAIVLALAWLRLLGEARGLYSSRFGVALFTTGTVAMLCGVICLGAQVLVRAQAQQMRLSDDLEAERARLAAVLGAVPAGVTFAEAPSGRVVLANPQVERILSCTTGADTADSPNFAPESFHSDGRRLEDDEWPLARALAGSEVAPEEFRIRRDDGREIWLRVSASPVENLAGDRVGAVQIFYDVTNEKDTELRLQALTIGLERSNRDLQDFAFVASHDLQEPLRKIVTFGDFLSSEYGDRLDEQGRSYVKSMQSAARRMQTLIRELLAYSRVSSRAGEFVEVDLSSLAREILTDLEASLRETGGRVDIGVLPTIEAEPLQMRQLLQNLMGNALKFHRTDAAPIVTLSRDETSPDGWCQLRVEDNGIGFEPKYADRIFTVFQRLNARGDYEGTGVGLAICKKIVERHGGEITATGRPGRGSTFTLSLPLYQTRTGGNT